MKLTRIWAMPSSDTFDCDPIGALVKRYLSLSEISIDPFARNKGWASFTNDLNPLTSAQYHQKAEDFLRGLVTQGTKADLIIFDPPYSLRQVKECYSGIGDGLFTQEDTQNAILWKKEKDLCSQLLIPGGTFLHFGWHSNAMGKKRSCKIIEILLVAHGRAHNDTICTVEKKLSHQPDLL